MSGGRSLAAWLVWAVLATMHSCAPMAPAFAEDYDTDDGPTVAVGPTGSTVRDRAAGRALHDALSQELLELGGVRLATNGRARFVVHGSVTRLERHEVPDGIEIHCEVSLLLADRDSGRVRAMLQGRAGARGGNVARLERAAVQAAVRGALRPLPTSLRTL